MKSSEVRQMTDDEILKAIVEGKRKLLTFRIQRVNGRLEQGHLVKTEKRNIARFFTVLTERKFHGRK
ncbi:MAG: Ribosomal protein L29 [Leptospirillum sp. Group IV 'UBA BS']|jgi:ribosomal protein L29|nr:MAG: Ribosomal protein L29 [Leptospirillum sp. Group IV 'UBA BS']